jgi:hypothetical protein
MKLKLKKIYESLLDEEYPPEFNMEDFKKLNSFNKRIKYCQAKLYRISSGSGRIVYRIDDEKVLKLARNQKGLAQNEVEIQQGSDYYLDDIVANVFDSHPNNLWVEMELARKLKKSDFKGIVGFSWEDFINAVHNYGNTTSNNGRHTYYKDIDKDIEEAMWENDFISGIFDYIGNYGIPTGDLTKTSSYGIVKRNGSDHIVIIDFGFTHDVQKTHYS